MSQRLHQISDYRDEDETAGGDIRLGLQTVAVMMAFLVSVFSFFGPALLALTKAF